MNAFVACLYHMFLFFQSFDFIFKVVIRGHFACQRNIAFVFLFAIFRTLDPYPYLFAHAMRMVTK